MPTQFSCAKGHRWQTDGNGAAAHECPICGEQGAAIADTPPPQETIEWGIKEAPPLDPHRTVWNDIASDPVVFDSDPELEVPAEPTGIETAADSKLEGLTASAAAFRPTLP